MGDKTLVAKAANEAQENTTDPEVNAPHTKTLKEIRHEVYKAVAQARWAQSKGGDAAEAPSTTSRRYTAPYENIDGGRLRSDDRDMLTADQVSSVLFELVEVKKGVSHPNSTGIHSDLYAQIDTILCQSGILDDDARQIASLAIARLVIDEKARHDSKPVLTVGAGTKPAGRPNTSRQNYEALRGYDFASVKRDDPEGIAICAKYMAACDGLKRAGVEILTEADTAKLRIARARVQANTRLKRRAQATLPAPGSVS